jgi:hypothetical protein
MNTIKHLAGVTAAFLLLATSSFATDVTPEPALPGQWAWIGDIRVGRPLSRDTLRLRGSHTDFRAVKFSVANSTLHLDQMVVTFTDGTTANIGVGVDVPPGTVSPAYDLPGGRRNIRRIDFSHQTVGSFRGPAVVSVFGLK